MGTRARRTAQGMGGLRLQGILACLALATVLSGCFAGVSESPLGAARVAATPIPGDPRSTGRNTGPTSDRPAHEELQALADRIADALAASDRLSARNALVAERAMGYDCDFRATFNGNAPFPSVEEAEAEAGKTAESAKPSDFAVATRSQSVGVLGVLVMAWCPRQSSVPLAEGKR